MYRYFWLYLACLPMLQVFRNIYHTFPVQLLLMHLKKHQILLIFWVILWLCVTGQFGKLYGIPYLFLDPEYLGKVDYLSFSILGAAFGGFLMTWNITTYILESSRFKFLATFERPFAVYCLNNAVIPLAFVITYFISAVKFQNLNEFAETRDILLDMTGFFSGMVIVIFLVAIYFQTTNKNIFNIFNLKIKEVKRIRKRVIMREDLRWEDYRKFEDEFRVDYYITLALGVRPIRGTTHYSEEMLRQVFRQNHWNAFFIEAATLATIIGLGFLIDYEIFRLPAAVSVILFLAILISLSGVLDFWFKKWKFIVLVAFIFLANFLIMRYDLFVYKNKAYGMDYEPPPARYTYGNLDSIASIENIRRDKLNTLAILDAWKEHTGERRPKIVFMNFSGGGLSAATFATAVIQKADSATDGELFKHTVLMTGASGGMIGAAYLRDLYLREQQHNITSLYNEQYPKSISKDLLNSTLFTFVSNDLVFPFQTFKIDSFSYRKDRGYMFEKQLNENTNYTMDRPIGYYNDYEQAGLIPLMILSPTITNDQRQLLICNQPVTYLMRPSGKNYRPTHTDIDAVDFMTMFKNHQPENLRMTTAVRMNATYPYILPQVMMPSEPVIKLMDAGYRDNYGLRTTARFIYTFRDWIKQNTSGVVIVQVRQYKKEREIDDPANETIISNLFTPFATVYNNMTAVQDYDQTYLLNYVSESMNGNISLITFEYNPEKKEEEASLSFRLTSKEVDDILRTVERPYVEENIKQLKDLLE